MVCANALTPVRGTCPGRAPPARASHRAESRYRSILRPTDGARLTQMTAPWGWS